MRYSQTNMWMNELDQDFTTTKESGSLHIQGKELIEDEAPPSPFFIRRQVVEPWSGARYFGEPYKVPKSNYSSIAKPKDENAIQHRQLVQFIRQVQGVGPKASRLKTQRPSSITS